MGGPEEGVAIRTNSRDSVLDIWRETTESQMEEGARVPEGKPSLSLNDLVTQLTRTPAIINTEINKMKERDWKTSLSQTPPSSAWFANLDPGFTSTLNEHRNPLL